jgi:hypothetical protein
MIMRAAFIGPKAASIKKSGAGKSTLQAKTARFEPGGFAT